MKPIIRQQLEATFGVSIRNEQLWQTALTHKSYSNEHAADNNERLEYLGDAVLELVVSEYLYDKYPDISEGLLTKYRSAIVCGAHLAQITQRLELAPLLTLARGERRAGGSKKNALLADMLEALVGALHLDCGIDAVRKFVVTTLFDELDDIVANKRYLDAKSALQEWAQEYFSATPTYELLAAEGADHQKTYTMQALLNGAALGTDTGTSKKKAEIAAAAAALQNLPSHSA